jgi:hypothetical protein
VHVAVAQVERGAERLEPPQVQVDGYKVIAVASGTTYDFRGTTRGGFRRCT